MGHASSELFRRDVDELNLVGDCDHGVGFDSSKSLLESDDNVTPTFGEASFLAVHQKGLACPRSDAKEDPQTSR